MDNEKEIINEWMEYIENREFPCVAAKAALSKQQLNVMVATHMGCPKDDKAILDFIYNFTDNHRASDTMFHSAVVIFNQDDITNEAEFDHLFWSRLQSLSNMDAKMYGYDNRVDSDPHSDNFSFSLKGEAYFIIGMSPASSRPARRFKYPAMVFNPHAQFEQLREARQYDKMKNIVRKRDIALAGNINPMLNDFGASSEVYQYTGQQLDNSWKCPLYSNHGHIERNQSA